MFMDSPSLPTDFADSLVGDLGIAEEWLSVSMTESLGLILIAAFGITVGFVAYKLIKRAINKA